VHDVIHSKQIWDRISQQFNIASLARPLDLCKQLDLRKQLTNLSKDPQQSMEVYLKQIKTVANTLASIRMPISDIDLVQLTLNGLDDDCHTLVTTLAYGSNLITI